MSKYDRIPKAFQLSDKARILRPEEMHHVRPEAFEPRNIKVRVTYQVLAGKDPMIRFLDTTSRALFLVLMVLAALIVIRSFL